MIGWNEGWHRGWVTGVVDFRYILIPLGTKVGYYINSGDTYHYMDVFIFGIRVARFHVDDVPHG